MTWAALDVRLASFWALVGVGGGLAISSELIVPFFSRSFSVMVTVGLTSLVVSGVLVGLSGTMFAWVTNPASWRVLSIFTLDVGFASDASFASSSFAGVGFMGRLTLTIVPSGFRTLTIWYCTASVFSSPVCFAVAALSVSFPVGVGVAILLATGFEALIVAGLDSLVCAGDGNVALGEERLEGLVVADLGDATTAVLLLVTSSEGFADRATGRAFKLFDIPRVAELDRPFEV